MKNLIALPLLGVLLLGRTTTTLAQSVGIGTPTPDAQAALDIKATDKGLLIPRLSAAQRAAIAAPPQGLLVYQTDGTTSGGVGTGFWYYAGSPAAWVFLNPAGGAADNLGNHTATTTLNLQSNALVGTGASLGTTVGVGVRADGGLNLGQNATGNNVYLGYQAGQNNSTGALNYFSGYQSGANNTTGFNNHFEGYQSGLSNTTSNNNQFIGNESGYANTTGTFNYFNGYRSGYRNTTGSYNYFSGMLSGRNNTLGSNNQFSGYQSGFSNSTGSNNQFSGYQSGFSNSTGNNNVFSGYQSGYVNSTGSENVFVGYQSGGDGVNRNGNTALGAYSGTYYNNITNSTALGYNTVLSTSNTVKLGNDDTRLLSCAVGLSVYSDARVKTDVRADVPGLAFVTRLRPVTYLFDAARLAALIQVPARPRRAEGPAADLTRHTGFLAQDVERVAQELGFDFDGLHRPAHARDPYALGYAQFVVPLVRAVQELNAEVETLKAQNTAMQVQNAALQTQAATDRAAAAAQSAGFAQRLQALEAAGAAASR